MADKHVLAELPLVAFVIINLTRLTAGICMKVRFKSKVTSNLRSYPPSLHLIAGKEGMIHFLFGSHVQKLEPGFFSDWSTNNTYDSLCSDWLSCVYETSGQKLVRRKKNA